MIDMISLSFCPHDWTVFFCFRRAHELTLTFSAPLILENLLPPSVPMRCHIYPLPSSKYAREVRSISLLLFLVSVTDSVPFSTLIHFLQHGLQQQPQAGPAAASPSSPKQQKQQPGHQQTSSKDLVVAAEPNAGPAIVREVTSGDSLHLYEVDLDHCSLKMSIHVSGENDFHPAYLLICIFWDFFFSGYPTSAAEYIFVSEHDDGNDLLAMKHNVTEKFELKDPKSGRTLLLKVDNQREQENGKGSVIASIYSPFWIINKVRYMLLLLQAACE